MTSSGNLIGVVRVTVFLVVFAVVLLVASLGFYDLAPSELAGFASTIIGTLLGAVLALAIGIWLFDYQQRKITDTRREEFRALVQAELEETAQRLKDSGAIQPEPTAMDHVQPLALQEAVRSALFPPEFAKEMMALARQFHLYNAKVSDTLSIPGRYNLDTRGGWDRLVGAQKGLASQAGYIIELCEELLKHPELASQDPA
jgi:uncharacterized membrane protein YccC